MRSPNRPTPRRRRLVLPFLAGGLVLAACGGDDDDGASSAAPAATTAVAGNTATTPAAGGTVTASEFNDADVVFAQGMIVHHEQAIEMAEIAEDPARQAGPEVLDLAGRVKAAQDPEIATMTGWLTAWGQPVEMDTSEEHDVTSMPGMMSADDMDALAAMTGPDIDDTWLTMMIEHHQGAIDMATAEQIDGMNADAQALAAQIIAAQQAEVDEMTTLLDG